MWSEANHSLFNDPTKNIITDDKDVEDLNAVKEKNDKIVKEEVELK